MSLTGAAWGGVFPDAAGVALSGTPAAVAVDASGPPDAAATLRAYTIVEAYVRGAGGLDALRDTAPTAAVHGCSVVLRLAGEVIGRGSSIGLPGELPSAVRIAEAAAAAWEEAERRMPVGGKPEVRAAKVRELRQDLLISLELSGPLVRIAAAGYGDLDLSLQPGLDGLAAAMDGKISAVFPGAAIAGNVMTGDSARRAVAAVAVVVRGEGGSTVSLTEPGELEKKHGVTLYRFRTTHVAQWRADKGPELLYRGQKLVLQQEIDDLEELWYTADRLAGNLCNRLTLKDGTAGGNVSLTIGDAEQADAFSAGLASYALSMHAAKRSRARGGAADDGVGGFVDHCNDSADRYLALATAAVRRAEEKDKLAASAVMVRCRVPKKLIEQEATLAKSFEAGAMKSTVPTGVRGLTVWGSADWALELARVQGNRVDTPGVTPIQPVIRSLFAQTAVSVLPGEMPWLGWVELEGDQTFSRPPGQKSASVLREMRTLVWKHQLQTVDAGPDGQDLVGGIVVPGSKSPLPTWQTARLVAFLGTMLGEPELTTKAERGGEIVKLLGAARFLRQLQVDDAMEWVCKDPAVVKGGLRNATWDQRTQTDATAMGLLAVLEIIGGVEKVSAAAEPNGHSPDSPSLVRPSR